MKTVGTLIRIIWKIEGCPTLGMGLSLSSLNYTSEYWDRDNLNQYREYMSLITRNMISPVHKFVVKYLGPANYTFAEYQDRTTHEYLPLVARNMTVECI